MKVCCLVINASLIDNDKIDNDKMEGLWEK